MLQQSHKPLFEHSEKALDSLIQSARPRVAVITTFGTAQIWKPTVYLMRT